MAACKHHLIASAGMPGDGEAGGAAGGCSAAAATEAPTAQHASSAKTGGVAIAVHAGRPAADRPGAVGVTAETDGAAEDAAAARSAPGAAAQQQQSRGPGKHQLQGKHEPDLAPVRPAARQPVPAAAGEQASVRRSPRPGSAARKAGAAPEAAPDTPRRAGRRSAPSSPQAPAALSTPAANRTQRSQQPLEGGDALPPAADGVRQKPRRAAAEEADKRLYAQSLLASAPEAHEDVLSAAHASVRAPHDAAEPEEGPRAAPAREQRGANAAARGRGRKRAGILTALAKEAQEPQAVPADGPAAEPQLQQARVAALRAQAAAAARDPSEQPMSQHSLGPSFEATLQDVASGAARLHASGALHSGPSTGRLAAAADACDTDEDLHVVEGGVKPEEQHAVAHGAVPVTHDPVQLPRRIAPTSEVAAQQQQESALEFPAEAAADVAPQQQAGRKPAAAAGASSGAKRPAAAQGDADAGPGQKRQRSGEPEQAQPQGRAPAGLSGSSLSRQPSAAGKEPSVSKAVAWDAADAGPSAGPSAALDEEAGPSSGFSAGQLLPKAACKRGGRLGNKQAASKRNEPGQKLSPAGRVAAKAIAAAQDAEAAGRAALAPTNRCAGITGTSKCAVHIGPCMWL